MNEYLQDDIKTLIAEVRKGYPEDEIAIIYNTVRTQILDEIRITRMITILADLYHGDRKQFEMILELLVNPLASMSSIARRLETTRQNLTYHIHRAADQYPEIRTLLEIRQVKKGKHERGAK